MLEDDLKKLGDGVQGLVDTVAGTLDDAVQEASDLVTESVEEIRGAVDATVGDARAALPSLEDVLAQALLLPGVEVDREEFLSAALRRQPASVITRAIEQTPTRAGIPLSQISRIAGKSLGREARRTTVVSFAAGIPGGMAAAATIPADLIQLYAHLIRAIQMLSYLYGWRDTCRVEGMATRKATKRALVLFLGAMAGNETAEKELARLASLRGTRMIETRLCAEGMVEQVSQGLEMRMAHRMTGQVVGKSVPLVGAVISGTISYGGFSDMWKRLRAVLERIEVSQMV